MDVSSITNEKESNMLDFKRKKIEKNDTITEKNTLEGIDSRITEKEEWIRGLEDMMLEIIAAEKDKAKTIKRNENHLRELFDNFKYTNIIIIRISEGGKRKDLRNFLKRYSCKRP